MKTIEDTSYRIYRVTTETWLFYGWACKGMEEGLSLHSMAKSFRSRFQSTSTVESLIRSYYRLYKALQEEKK